MSVGVGMVRGVAYCSVKGGLMVETNRAETLVGLGLRDEPWHQAKRGVTLLSVESWRDACHELGTDLVWTLRRANVLIEGVDLGTLIGRTIAIGDGRYRVHGETKPCGLMDQQHNGLRAALVPAMRGGVHAEVLTAGTIRGGDRVSVVEE